MPSASQQSPSDLKDLSQQEREIILSVLRRDEELKAQEEKRLSQLREEISDLQRQKAVKYEGANRCALCSREFGFFFDTGVVCSQCKAKVCNNCHRKAVYNRPCLCSLCYKQMLMVSQSGEWFRFKEEAAANKSPSSTNQRPDNNVKRDSITSNAREKQALQRLSGKKSPGSVGEISTRSTGGMNNVQSPREVDEVRLRELLVAQKKKGSLGNIHASSFSGASSSSDDESPTPRIVAAQVHHPQKYSSTANLKSPATKATNVSMPDLRGDRLKPRQSVHSLPQQQLFEESGSVVSYEDVQDFNSITSSEVDLHSLDQMEVNALHGLTSRGSMRSSARSSTRNASHADREMEQNSRSGERTPTPSWEGEETHLRTNLESAFTRVQPVKQPAARARAETVGTGAHREAAQLGQGVPSQPLPRESEARSLSSRQPAAAATPPSQRLLSGHEATERPSSLGSAQVVPKARKKLKHSSHLAPLITSSAVTGDNDDDNIDEIFAINKNYLLSKHENLFSPDADEAEVARANATYLAPNGSLPLSSLLQPVSRCSSAASDLLSPIVEMPEPAFESDPRVRQKSPPPPPSEPLFPSSKDSGMLRNSTRSSRRSLDQQVVDTSSIHRVPSQSKSVSALATVETPQYNERSVDGLYESSASIVEPEISVNKERRVSFVEPARSYGSRESVSSVNSEVFELYGTVPVTGDVMFGVAFDYKKNILTVTVKQCRGLAVANAKKGCTDPYAKVYLLPDKSRGAKRKTKVKKNTIEPVFNEELKYRITKGELENRSLSLTVWHYDIFGRNQFLGESLLHMGSFDFRDEMPKWYPLHDKAPTAPMPNMTYVGDFLLAVKFIPPEHNISQRGVGSTKGALHVYIRKANNLTPSRPGGTCDPFCKGYLLPNLMIKMKTDTLHKECCPQWDDTFKWEHIMVDDLTQCCLELTIWDHDRFSSNAFLGGVRLSLGTGFSYGEPVDWMDSTPDEMSLWRQMLEKPNEWAKATLPLRATMTSRYN